MISSVQDSIYFGKAIAILVHGIQVVLAVFAIRWSLSKSFLKRLRQVFRSRRYLNQAVSTQYYSKDEKDYRTLRRYLESAWHYPALQNPKTFIVLTVGVGAMALLYFTSRVGWKNGVVYSGFVAGFPFFITWMRVSTLQIKGSFEGDKVLTRLKNVLSNNGGNMRQAIKKMVTELEDCSVSKRAFFQLAYKLERIQTEEELDIAMGDFAFVTDTKWANSLGRKMKAAIIDRIDIVDALILDLNHLNASKKSLEYFKNVNFENLMLIVVSPVLMVASAWFLMFNPYKPMGIMGYMDLQFRTATGLSSFMKIAFFWTINYASILYFRRKKMDLFKG